MRVRRRLLSESLLTAVVASSALLVAAPASAAFPGDNGRIAYVTTAGDHKVIFTVDGTGRDPQLLIDLGGGRDAINPAWSWDGVKVAFAGQTSQGGPLAIFVASAGGTGQPVQVTTPLVSDTDPAWSPNGQEIAFTHQGSDGTSVIPTGFLNFSYGKFKLQSEDLDWLVVTGGDTAYVLGSASIHGTGGLFPFRATIRDGASSTAPDHLVLEVWGRARIPCGTSPPIRPQATPGDRSRSRAKVPAIARRQMLARSDDAHHAEDG